MTPASKLQEKLKSRVQKSGGQYRKVRWEGRRGCPDCFVWFPDGRLGFIEVKAPGDRFSKLQEREVRRMAEDGLPVFTVTCEADIEAAVDAIRGCNL